MYSWKGYQQYAWGTISFRHKRNDQLRPTSMLHTLRLNVAQFKIFILSAESTDDQNLVNPLKIPITNKHICNSVPRRLEMQPNKGNGKTISIAPSLLYWQGPISFLYMYSGNFGSAKQKYSTTIRFWCYVLLQLQQYQIILSIKIATKNTCLNFI